MPKLTKAQRRFMEQLAKIQDPRRSFEMSNLSGPEVRMVGRLDEAGLTGRCALLGYLTRIVLTDAGRAALQQKGEAG